MVSDADILEFNLYTWLDSSVRGNWSESVVQQCWCHIAPSTLQIVGWQYHIFESDIPSLIVSTVCLHHLAFSYLSWQDLAWLQLLIEQVFSTLESLYLVVRDPNAGMLLFHSHYFVSRKPEHILQSFEPTSSVKETYSWCPCTLILLTRGPSFPAVSSPQAGSFFSFWHGEHGASVSFGWSRGWSSITPHETTQLDKTCTDHWSLDYTALVLEVGVSC